MGIINELSPRIMYYDHLTKSNKLTTQKLFYRIFLVQLIKESSKKNVYSRNIIEVMNNCIDFSDADVTR